MNKKIQIAIIVVASILILAGVGSLVAYNSLFGAPQSKAEPEQFTMPLLGSGDFRELSARLKEKGFIKSEAGFKIAFFKKNGVGITATTCVDCFSPGAYKISKSMSAWELAEAIRKPYMKWIVIPEGLRKEQIVELIGDTLALRWDQETKRKWVGNYTAMNYDYIEGVYFPDTYLIPVDEAPLQVAQRLINKFNEKFQPYADKFVKANIKWTTAIKLASIVQREAADKDDMSLVAGILWNRLLKDMKLETDATIQYVRDSVTHYGKEPGDVQLSGYTSEGTWWTPIEAEDIKIESPYNTYLNKGLPSHPICNPGIEAITAVLNPTQTECLYYLHDTNGQIHCAKTYEEHQANIEQYLR